MAIQKSEAICLRSFDLRETSRIVTFYTMACGKIRGVVKGIRGPRAQTTGYLEPFTAHEVVFYERQHSDLYLVTQWELKDAFRGIRNDLSRIAYASYFVDLIDHLTQIGDRNEGLYELLYQCLKLLEIATHHRQIARVFELKVLTQLGYAPQHDPEALALSKGSLAWLSQIERSPWEKVGRLRMSREVEQEITRTLRRSLDREVSQKLRSIVFLEKMGEGLQHPRRYATVKLGEW